MSGLPPPHKPAHIRGTVLPHAANRHVTRTLNTSVGDLVYVDQYLNVQAVGIAMHRSYGDLAPEGVANYSNQALAGDTAVMNLDPLTAGVALVSASGTDYATPVPEPAAACSAATAAALLPVLRRRRH